MLMIRSVFVFAVVFSTSGLFECRAGFSQTGITFDVPAVVRANVQSVAAATGEKTVEIKMPVSVAIEAVYRAKIRECQFDIRWSGHAFAIEDFQPRTKTGSSIDGLINVDQDQTQNASVNFNLAAAPLELSSARLVSDLGWGNSRHETFKEVPRHETLVASGTLERATGAFFRFHPSATEAIEGVRELSLTYRVPSDWTTGILQVECRAAGANEVAGLWKEPFEITRSFVVPVFEDQNVAAQKLAIDFASAEQEFRSVWAEVQRQRKKANPLLWAISSQRMLPEQWPQHFIGFGDDQYFSPFRGYVTDEVTTAAEAFLEARRSLSYPH